jgi:hypothetical protein
MDLPAVCAVAYSGGNSSSVSLLWMAEKAISLLFMYREFTVFLLVTYWTIDFLHWNEILEMT